MLALGFFITPALLGGRKDIMIAVEEADREMYAAKAIRKRKAPVTR